MTGKNRKLVAFEAYALYLLTGAACIVIGSSMSQLTKSYGATLAAIAALGSAFALGRSLTVFLTGYITEKFGAKFVLFTGISLLLVFLVGLPLCHNFYFGLVFAALGGIGMGSQDAVCPIILSVAFPTNYAGAMSAGQALFGAGCFLPPMLMSAAIMLNLPFYYPYLAFAALAIVMLVILPFTNIPSIHESAEQLASSDNAIELKNKALGYAFLGIVCFAYCAIINTINLYTATFAESLGIVPALAVALLTVYNVGSMTGSFAFIGILRKMKPVNVLVINTIAAIICLGTAVLVRKTWLFFVALFVAGVCLGVLFSVIVTLATGLNPSHAGLAGALVAVVAGASDTITPLITGSVITLKGPSAAYPYALIMMAITLVASVGFKAMCKHKSEK